jgi:hypothetical protein
VTESVEFWLEYCPSDGSPSVRARLSVDGTSVLPPDNDPLPAAVVLRSVLDALESATSDGTLVELYCVYLCIRDLPGDRLALSLVYSSGELTDDQERVNPEYVVSESAFRSQVRDAAETFLERSDATGEDAIRDKLAEI